MEKPAIDPEERMICLLDVKQLYISMRKRLFNWALLGALAFFLYFGHEGAVYKAEASFKDVLDNPGQEDFIKGLIAGFSSPSQPQASTLMKSNQVLRPVVEKLGLQIRPWFHDWGIIQLLKRYPDSWRAENQMKVKDPDSFIFEQVCYDGDKFKFAIQFFNPCEYSIYAGKKKIGSCSIGEPCFLKGASFVLRRAPKNIKMGKLYRFSLNDWQSCVKKLKSRVKIKADKDNNSILILSVTDRNRHLAAKIVNQVMDEFHAYLKREYDFVAKHQLTYLEEKQGHLLQQMDQLFDQHIVYLKENLSENGFSGLDEATQNLLVPSQQIYAKLLAIDVELMRLAEIEKEGKVVAIAEEGPFSACLNHLVQKIHDLKQQRDLIELSLAQPLEPILEIRRDEINEVRKARFSVEALIQEIDQKGKIASCDLAPAFANWANFLSDSQDRHDFTEYLENYSRLLGMREKMLQERCFYGSEPPQELQGIDLSSARNLFMQYNSKLDAAEANLQQYAQLKQEVPSPNYDLARLSSLLQDSLSQKIISEAVQLEVKLKDEKNYTAKEAGRWKEEIDLRRNILIERLEQLTSVEKLNTRLLREKMAGLQRISLDCINQQISVLYGRAMDAIKERKKALVIEKEVLETKLMQLRGSLAAVIPETWRFEKWLAIKTETLGKMIETLTAEFESKSLKSQLHHIESKPLDRAAVPFRAKPPYLIEMTFLGCFVFPFLFFSLALIQTMVRGFPASYEKLKALKFPCLGKLSAFCDGKLSSNPMGSDLEVLRNISLFLGGAKVVGLIHGKGPDYSYALGENMAKSRIKSMIIRCDFRAVSHLEDQPGLLQFWEGQEPAIRKRAGFEYMTAGGYSLFGTEIIQSSRFADLIAFSSQNYDRVFLLFRSPLDSAEARVALGLCDKAIVTISGEQIEELTPFVDWGYDGDNCRITFIMAT